jgi:hypothetical protein
MPISVRFVAEKQPTDRAAEEVQEVQQGVQQAAADASVRKVGASLSGIVSAVALIFSGYSLWETSLKAPELRVFVPAVIQYAAPYTNSNFEMVSIPVTLTNEGARTGTVLSIGLEVTDPRTSQTKRFYAAELGRWTMERTRQGAYQHFAPLALAGRASRTETVLFYTRGDEEKPPQLIREIGPYKMKLTLEMAEAADAGFLDRLLGLRSPSLSFERELRFYDARAFNNGTLPMYAKDWQTSVSGK